MKERIKKLYSGVFGFVKKNGTYFMLMLCLLVVAVAVAFLFPTSYDKTQDGNAVDVTNAPSPTEKASSVAGQDDQSIKDVTKIIPDNEQMSVWPPDIHGINAMTATSNPQNSETPKQPEKSLLSPPVQGSIVWAYAMNMLTYSKTLDQWTTHSGVDIEAEPGTNVRTVAAGTVERVYEDTGLGITVIILHENGHKTVYANLAQDEALATEGAAVEENTIIGTIGKTASFECEEKSHLHFEYLVDGEPQNPADYVLFVGK